MTTMTTANHTPGHIHTVARTRGDYTSASDPHVLVPLAYAVTLTWDRPITDGDWLVVERPYRDSPSGEIAISDSGVIKVRRSTKTGALSQARALKINAYKRGVYLITYQVIHVSEVVLIDSDQAHGCLAGGL